MAHYPSTMKNVTKKKSLAFFRIVLFYFIYFLEFFFDEETHLEQRNKLSAMLSGDVNPNIEFTIVSEPLREEMNMKECLEVGFVIFYFLLKIT